jgi:hypothetical protein
VSPINHCYKFTTVRRYTLADPIRTCYLSTPCYQSTPSLPVYPCYLSILPVLLIQPLLFLAAPFYWLICRCRSPPLLHRTAGVGGGTREKKYLSYQTGGWNTNNIKGGLLKVLGLEISREYLRGRISLGYSRTCCFSLSALWYIFHIFVCPILYSKCTYVLIWSGGW